MLLQTIAPRGLIASCESDAKAAAVNCQLCWSLPVMKCRCSRPSSISLILEGGVQRFSERYIARVSGQCGAHSTRHIAVSDAGVRIGKP